MSSSRASDSTWADYLCHHPRSSTITHSAHFDAIPQQLKHRNKNLDETMTVVMDATAGMKKRERDYEGTWNLEQGTSKRSRSK